MPNFLNSYLQKQHLVKKDQLIPKDPEKFEREQGNDRGILNCKLFNSFQR